MATKEESTRKFFVFFAFFVVETAASYGTPLGVSTNGRIFA